MDCMSKFLKMKKYEFKELIIWIIELYCEKEINYKKMCTNQMPTEQANPIELLHIIFESDYIELILL